MKIARDNQKLKRTSRSRTIMYILDKGGVSRQELAAALGFSMPTVFQIVGDLIESGLVCEKGKYDSTGGRKAKILTIKQGIFCSVGVEITAHHVRFILMDMNREILDVDQIELVYENSFDYYFELGQLVQSFILKNDIGVNNPSKLIGVGIALPGIIDQEKGMLTKSHALNVDNVGLLQFSQNIPFPVLFGNDANLASYAEVKNKHRNTVYLSLNDTVGGAIYLNGEIYEGDKFKSGEFGHMIVMPGGKRCYCGKHGCLDAYCSAKVLFSGVDGDLSSFFDSLELGDNECKSQWDSYLDYLAISTSNLRMVFDCDIILGGHVGGYLHNYMRMFGEKVCKYNNFDTDLSYIQLGQHRWEAAALGAARMISDNYIINTDLCMR